MRRLGLLALVATLGCGHTRPADPKSAPSPRPAAPMRSSVPVADAPLPTTPASKDHAIPEEDAPRPFTPPVPQRARLANGMDVLLVKRTNLPIVSFTMVWPSGAADDPPQRAGMAALTSSLITEGAGSRSALELAAEVQRLGARLSAFSTWDATTVSLTTLQKVIDPALGILADVVLRPHLAAADLERIRSESRTMLLQANDQAATQAQLAGARALYGDNSRYGSLVTGSPVGLTAIKRDEVVAWHRDRLSVRRATLVAVGDIDMPALRAKLEQLFPAAGKATHQLPPAKAVPAIRADRAVLLVDRPGAAQTEMRAYAPGPTRLTADYFPLLVMNTIFGGNFSSWLNAKLREEKGYTYGARSDFAFRRNGGPFTAGAPVKTAVTRPALVDLLAQLERLERGEMVEVELRIAKQQLQRSMARYFDTAPEVAQALAGLVVYGLPDEYYATYADKVQRVTLADLSRVAHKLRAGKMSLVFVGDEKVIGQDIKEVLGTYQKVDVSPK